MNREDNEAELEEWRNEARRNDSSRARAQVSMGAALGGGEEKTRDVPCRGCRRPVAMTETGAWFGKQAASMAALNRFAPIMVHEIMLCKDCEKAQEHRRAVEFEAWQQEFVPRVKRSKENGRISAEDREWFLANDCARTVDGLEERFERMKGKGKTGKSKSADDGAGFGKSVGEKLGKRK